MRKQKSNNRPNIVEQAIIQSGVRAPRFSSKDFCFDKQLAFIKSNARFKTAVCSRRAGKTVGIAADLIDTCLTERDVLCLYVTLTSTTARTIIWSDIKRIVQDYKLNVHTDDTRLEVTFLETRSKIKLGGAKDETEIEKYRGWKLRKAYIDECQSFRPYVKYFIDDILIPALRDLRGTLSLTGTPGPVPAGPFFEYASNPEWEHHYWTAFDNPFMHNPPERDLNITLAEERKIKGITEDDPGYLRETYGRWIEDFNSLVFKFSKDKNIYDKLPDKKYDYVFGVDVGFEDSDAIAVLAYCYEDRNVYLVDELIKEKQTIEDLANQIKHLRDIYKPIKMVMDAGALGKKIQAEMQSRYQLPLEAADKHRKFEFIELLNADLRTGRLKAFEGSRFEQDCQLVQWDRSNPVKPKISDIYHSDINDAVLYAWRECRHYFATINPPKPKYGTPEYWEQLDREMLEADLKKATQPEKEFWEEENGTDEFWEK